MNLDFHNKLKTFFFFFFFLKLEPKFHSIIAKQSQTRDSRTDGGESSNQITSFEIFFA